MKRNLYIILIINIKLLITGWCNSSYWPVPSNYKTLKNPVSISVQSILNGEKIYKKNCISCHGSNADGKGLMLSPSFISPEFYVQSDGAIFYKIITGRNMMPSFKIQLTENQIWEVIHYIRSLIDKENYPTITLKRAKIETDIDSFNKVIYAYLVNENGDTLINPKLTFYAKQAFGWLKLSDYEINKRRIKVSIPQNIVGDTSGKLFIRVSLEKNDQYSDTNVYFSISTINILPRNLPNNNYYNLWGDRKHVPIWLLILIYAILLIIIGTLFYIMLLLVKMYLQRNVK